VGARWGGISAWERRREELGEGRDALRVLRGFYRGRGGRQRGVARVTAALMALAPLKTVARLRGGLRGRGSDGGAVMAWAASRGAERAVRGAVAWWYSVATRPGSADAGWKTELTAGAYLTER
jgi:hypothetical protein